MNVSRLEDLGDLVTVAEATAFLRVSRNTVYAAIIAGQLPCIRLGRRKLIPKVGLARLIEVCSSQSSHEEASLPMPFGKPMHHRIERESRNG